MASLNALNAEGSYLLGTGIGASPTRSEKTSKATGTGGEIPKNATSSGGSYL